MAPTVLEYIRAIRDDRELSTSEKLAAIIMASHNETNAHPGMALLAAEIGLKERQTKTIVASLVHKGWLVLVKSGRGGYTKNASVYALSLPQGATDCTLGGANSVRPSKCNLRHVKVQSTTSQSAVDCTTNAFDLMPLEIPLRSDDLSSQTRDQATWLQSLPGASERDDARPIEVGFRSMSDVPEPPHGVWGQGVSRWVTLDEAQDLLRVHGPSLSLYRQSYLEDKIERLSV